MRRETLSLGWNGFETGIGLDSSRRRFAVAVCASVLLHWIALAAYDPHASIQIGLLAQSSWRALDATLRLPGSSVDAPAGNLAESDRIAMPPALREKAPVSSAGAEGTPSADAAQPAIPAVPENTAGNAAGSTAPPRIDIDAAHRLARQLARAESTHRTAQPNLSVPPPSTREAQLGRAIAASVRADCRTAYAGAGLFAIPALIADALTDRGCKW